MDRFNETLQVTLKYRLHQTHDVGPAVPNNQHIGTDYCVY